MPEGGNEGKVANYIFFHEKKHENESCAVFRADHFGPVGKNMIFCRSIRAGSGPVPIAPIGFLYAFGILFKRPWLRVSLKDGKAPLWDPT